MRTVESPREPFDTWRLVIQYDGSAFSGFQRQLTHVTVQSTLEDALAKMFGEPRVIVHASGRTDAGVHALGQVVSFRTKTPRIPHHVRMGLNTMLPKELSIAEATIEDSAFHARYSAIGKTYRYRIWTGRDRSPFQTGYSLHARWPLDWSAIEAAMSGLVGTLDYTTFRGAGCTAKTSIRTIDRAIHHDQGQQHELEFHGNGFLRYQVRRMVGTLLEVGAGRRTVGDFAAALASKDRNRSGKTALACGLYLVSVDYPPGAIRPPLAVATD